MRSLPGNPYPLGATWDGKGVNFAIYSERASRIELCLLDEAHRETRVPLRERTAFVWHVYLPGIGPGQRYAYRAEGPYEPERGLRFNRNNLLLDPYAKALDGPEQWDAGMFAYELGASEEDLKKRELDARGAPLGVVVDPGFDWGDDRPPNTPFHESVVYETHVRGMTMRHPEVPEHLRGKFGGLASEPMIQYFKQLGVTAVELLPVHAFVDDKLLLDKGLRNYWGYSSIGFFAPDTRYRTRDAAGDGVREFKGMVKALHAAGIEVILDVVYNHTAEGNHLGPTLAFKGIDNLTYYRVVEQTPRFYFDYTGTGNSLNVRHPQTLQLIMDSLRYWVTEMHVDGFRFDLASTLARSLHEVDQLSSFFTLVHQDPTLSQVKLIAEPWDVGEGGYQVGNFPVRWAEWNGKYRDTIRAFWRGIGCNTGELGFRLSGSSDLYENDGRRPYSSVNFVTAHDGFTLRDWVSYDRKHNEANLEGDRDGTNDNQSWNCGAEGETSDQGVLALRRRQMRNVMATLLLSQGTPMICGGDEIGRTQRGNNNAYCQDNETSWYDWQLGDDEKAMLAFTRRLIALRRKHPGLRRAKFFKGRRIRGTDVRDVLWLRHDGEAMTDADWSDPKSASLAMFLSGRGLDTFDEDGNAVVDDDLLLLVNGSHIGSEWVLPALAPTVSEWELLVDTGDDGAFEKVLPGGKTHLDGRTLKLFRRNAAGDRMSLTP
jgi:glycogen operon protein